MMPADCIELPVEQQRTVVALGALAHGIRLDLVSILARSGRAGMPAGTIASQLGVTPALMSFHLRQLVQAGLLTQRRRGRNIIYAIDQSAMQSLLSQLGDRCYDHTGARTEALHADAHA